jgi:hypothetical protein
MGVTPVLFPILLFMGKGNLQVFDANRGHEPSRRRSTGRQDDSVHIFRFSDTLDFKLWTRIET